MTIPIEVVTPPAPIVTPAEIRGTHSPSDPAIAALIAAVTASVAGPSGWLGRSLGVQTLRVYQPRLTACIRLPCSPIVEVLSVKYLDATGVEQTVSPGAYRLAGTMIVPTSGMQWPATANEPDAVRVTYQAGYTTPPAEAKQAIILGVQHLRDMGGTSVFLRSDTVEGVSAKSWFVSPQASEAVHSAIGHLLANLRLYE